MAILPTLPDDEEEWCAATAAEEEGGGTEVALADATDPPPVMVILRLLTQFSKARHSKDRDHVPLICTRGFLDDINCKNCLLVSSIKEGASGVASIQSSQ